MISVALRTGAPVSEPHACRCGRLVDRLGHHGLSCRYSAGRLPRHANINDLVKRAPLLPTFRRGSSPLALTWETADVLMGLPFFHLGMGNVLHETLPA